MFIKVVENSAWDFGEAVSEPIKVSSRGLTYNDKRDFVKRASAELVDKVASMDLKPGEVPVHVIAMGTTESYGPNRNGDGFSRQACKEYHPYFVKDARLYRNHKNTDKSQSYGIVKASAFNPEMDRVELILALNSTKQAADANNGLVADKEMEKLGSAKDIPVSMACTPDKDMPVLTKDKGYIGIGEVEVGMRVLTKEGRWRKVTEVKQREYSGPIYTIYIKDLPIPLRFTEEHPLWSREDDEYAWLPVSQIQGHFELAYMNTPENTTSKSISDYIESKLTTQDQIYIHTDKLSVYLAARDYCLATSKRFDGFTTYDRETIIYGLSINLQKYPRKLSHGVFPATITKVKVQQGFTGTVYNLEVEEDHNYSAAGIVSHNCKVPYDVCSCCGNKAATREEYCKDIDSGGRCKAGGLYHNMGKTASVDGKIQQLYADNTQPYFFDISNVFIPADRIAYTTGIVKKSSAGIISGADLAEMYGLYSNQMKKRASYYEMDPDYRHALTCLCNAVTDFHTGELWKKQANFAGVLDTEPLTEMGIPRQYGIDKIAKALNSVNKCLTPTQFLQITADTSFQKAAGVGEIIAPLSNEAFSSILANENAYNPFMTGSNTVPEKLKEWAFNQKCAFWSQPYRIKQAAMKSITVPQRHKYSRATIYSLQDSPEVSKLSEQYAMYKAAFVASLPREQRQSIANMLVGRDYIGF